MPLISRINIAGAELLLWRATETEEELAALVTTEDVGSVAGFASESRRRERLAWRAALRAAEVNESVAYSETGAPYLVGSDRWLSVSHCADMACVALSPYRCGLDIEPEGRDCTRIVRRFLSERERVFFADMPNPGCAAWCVKEALYKYAGREGVDFLKDISITGRDGSTLRAVVCGQSTGVMLSREEGCIIALAAGEPAE